MALSMMIDLPRVLTFFSFVYFSILGCLNANPIDQEWKVCGAELLHQIKNNERPKLKNCPNVNKLIIWFGIQNNIHDFTFDEIIAFVDNSSHWPLHDHLKIKVEKYLGPHVAYQSIIKWFKKYPPRTYKGAKLYIHSLKKEKRDEDAKKAIKSAWNTVEFNSSELKEFISNHSKNLGPKDYSTKLDHFLWDEKVKEAKILMAYVSKKENQIAKLRLALIENKQDSSLSASRLKPYLGYEGVLYNYIKWLRKQKMFADAAKLLLSIPKKHSRNEQWWYEINYIARELIALKKYKEAYTIIILHNLDKGESYATAEWVAGWLALRFLNQPQKARKHFTAMYQKVSSPLSRSRGSYWVARALEQEGSPEAKTWYKTCAKFPATFYGQQALIKLGHASLPELMGCLRSDFVDRIEFEKKDLVKAVHFLNMSSLNNKNHFRSFLVALAKSSTSDEEKELTVHLANNISPPNIIWAARSAAKTNYLLSMLAYPTFKIPSNAANLEESIIFALAYQESRGDPEEISKAGAIGLLQLIPVAAKEIAQSLKIPFSKHKLKDPHYNTLLGSFHFYNAYVRYDKSLPLALAAYNAGCTPVDRWIKTYGDPRKGEVDMIDWIELIPYKETRNYVQRVWEARNVYRRMFNKPMVKL